MIKEAKVEKERKEIKEERKVIKAREKEAERKGKERETEEEPESDLAQKMLLLKGHLEELHPQERKTPHLAIIT